MPALTGGPVFGEVASDGSVELGGLGEDADNFMRSLDTLDKIWIAARAPNRVQVLSLG